MQCSRNSENNTVKYPDIAASVPGLVKPGTKSVVLDCEAVAFERETGKILPFQVVCQLLPDTPRLPTPAACLCYHYAAAVLSKRPLSGNLCWVCRT